MSISNTPKRTTFALDDNNNNNNNQTPRTPKSQQSTKQFRATPSPMRSRKPLFDDTPPIQRYKVQMAKNRFDTSKNYRKEIRNIFHQSDQFAIFQQKSALATPVELTPERYILGKFNTAPEKFQKDRGFSRKVTRRTDLYDRNPRYIQDTTNEYKNNENSEVLVEEIEEIDVITEEQQNSNDPFDQSNNKNLNEHNASDLQLNNDNNNTNHDQENKGNENNDNLQHEAAELVDNDAKERDNFSAEEEIGELTNFENEEEENDENSKEKASNSNNNPNEDEMMAEEESQENEELQIDNDTLNNNKETKSAHDENENNNEDEILDNKEGNENESQNNEEDINDLNTIQRGAVLQIEEEDEEQEKFTDIEQRNEVLLEEEEQDQEEEDENEDHENDEDNQDNLDNQKEEFDDGNHKESQENYEQEEEKHEESQINHDRNGENNEEPQDERNEEDQVESQENQDHFEDSLKDLHDHHEEQQENNKQDEENQAEPQGNQEQNEDNHEGLHELYEESDHENRDHPHDSEDEIPTPDFETQYNNTRTTNREIAEPFMPPSSPPRFQKLDKNDPEINHTGDQLLEISLRPYLYSLSNKYGTPISKIRDIPEMEFNDWQSMGFDWVWLYGVWQIGDFVIQHDLTDEILLKRYREYLPDWTRDDVIGYPLCINKYEVCPEVGSEEDLQWFRMEIKKRGIKLMLDFVPNDTAIDSPEMISNPDFYIRSPTPTTDPKFDSSRFMINHDGVAFGAGEFMPPMHFNAQLNLFNRRCRDYQIERILKVSELCDGLRIHLAQYLINSKFAQFWNNELFDKGGTNIVDIDYTNENEEFWLLAISKIRENHPNFVMMAESYGYENQEKLLNCGFNYVYEKELLDKLVYSDVKGFRDLIFNNEFLTSKKMVHFVENHDEVRALHHFWKDERMACAASAALLTLPGIRLINFHQWLGYMNQIDVNLRRSYDPHINKYIMLFYVRLFRVLDTNAIRFGQWTPKNVYESDTVIAWKWVKDKQHILVTINFSSNRSGGRIICNDAPTDSHEIIVHELISNTYYTRDPQVLIDTGLCLSLDKYETQIFEY